MPNLYRQSSIFLGSLLLLLSFMLPANAEQIALKLIDGRPCARATVKYGNKSIEANVVLDLGVQAPIVLHSKTGKLLGVKRGGKITLLFDGVNETTFADMPVLTSGIRALETLTQEHAAELDEIPAVAIIGLSAFSNFVPQLDLPQNRLVLLPREEAGELAKAATLVLPLEQVGPRLFFTAIGPDGMKIRLQLRTSQYDTLIDEMVAALAGFDNGAIEQLYPIAKGQAESKENEEDASGESRSKDKKRLNLAGFVAFRPFDLSAVSEPKPDMIIGTNLLEHFRVAIDLNRKQLLWEQVGQPEYPTHERDFFTALVSEDAEGVEAFLTKNPDSRLAQEAGSKLLEFRLAEYPADAKALLRAIKSRASSTEMKRRATTLLTLADNWLGGEREDRYTLATNALQLALNCSRDDLDATASHRIQARLGRIAYTEGDLRTARRHLLSAAFGLPRDPQVNLWLGELYEAMKKPTRAWSRYLQATLAKDAPLEAYIGLGRLNRDPVFRDRFSMRDAAELLEGRIETFHPKRHYIQEKKEFPQHVKLVELFTNIDDTEETHAAEAALDAIGEYFDIETAKEPVAVLEYHIKAAKPDPLAVPFSQARADFYTVVDAPVAVFDGTESSYDYGKPEEIVPVYEAYIELARSKAKCVAPKVTLSGKVKRDKRQLTGKIVVRKFSGRTGTTVLKQGDDPKKDDPKKDDSKKKVDSVRSLNDSTLHVVVCESVVMVPGGNGRVLHRYVVRGSLTPDDGLPLAIKVKKGEAPFTFEVNLDTKKLTEELAQHMSELEKQNGVSLVMKPDYVDAREVILVAFVQNMTTQEILGVTTIRPTACTASGSFNQEPRPSYQEPRPVVAGVNYRLNTSKEATR